MGLTPDRLPTYVFKEGDIVICLGLTGDLRRLADVADGKS